MVVHTINPSTQEAGGSLWVQEVQDSQGYTEKPCLKTKTKQNKNKQKTKNKINKQTKNPENKKKKKKKIKMK